MADNHRRNDAKETIVAIRDSDDPYDILRLCFLSPASEYSASLIHAACEAMVQMLFENDKPQNVMGVRVIHAVLGMMRMSDDPVRVQLGCRILRSIDTQTSYMKLAPVSFIIMIDDIEDVVIHTLRKHRLSCYDCAWVLHPKSILRHTAAIRLHESRRCANERSISWTDWSLNIQTKLFG